MRRDLVRRGAVSGNEGLDEAFPAFSSTNALEAAELFFADLMGTTPAPVPRPRRETRLAYRRAVAPRPSFEAAEDTPTITLSAAEVIVLVGGVNNATVTATTTGGGAVTWTVDDTSRVRLRPSGNTLTIQGLHPGVTTLRATTTTAEGTANATARLLVVFIELTLRNTGTIEPAPENEDEATETAAAGGTNRLGPLAMGTGRADFAGTAFTSPCMVIGRVFPPEAATRFTFRWQRLITRRSWRFRRNAAGTRWTVTRRSARGPLDDDTGAAAFNDATPSTPGHRIYIYDNSALSLAGEAVAAGEFVHERKDFIYRALINFNGRFTICSAIHMGQVITARRTATSGTVATDWAGVENSTAIRTVTTSITSAEVRAIVGGTDPIDIDPAANT